MLILLFTIITLLSICFNADLKITEDEFNNAIKINGFSNPDSDIHPIFANATKDFTREELAMFLAHVIYESSGFYFSEDIVCSSEPNHCAERYADKEGLPGKSYYSRGFMRLTWARNYKAASHDLGLGDLLLKNPELVATDTNYAVQTSIWYWKIQVRPQYVKNPNKFGFTTKAIIGDDACRSDKQEEAKIRYSVYTIVSDVMKIHKKALENGCYN